MVPGPLGSENREDTRPRSHSVEHFDRTPSSAVSRETEWLLNFGADHRIESDTEVIPIQQANAAYERVIRGDVRFRFVIDLNILA
jgi:hypothetical protein